MDKERTMKKTLTAIAFSVVLAGPANADVKKMVELEAKRQGVPVSLAVAIAKQESKFRCGAVGRHGERGVMQIKPRTARGIGYRGSASGLNHCQTGIRYGIMYLNLAHRKAGGNLYRTALLYNAGLGTKRKRSAYAEEILRKCQCGRRNEAVRRR